MTFQKGWTDSGHSSRDQMGMNEMFFPQQEKAERKRRWGETTQKKNPKPTNISLESRNDRKNKCWLTLSPPITSTFICQFRKVHVFWNCQLSFVFFFRCGAVHLYRLIWKQAGRTFKATNLFFSFHYHSIFVFFRHDNTRTEGWLEHVNHQVIGKNIQLLYLITSHIGGPSNSIARAIARESTSWEQSTASSEEFCFLHL